jgi:hypothetical protein
MKAITRFMLFSLGAGAVLLWRSRQARDRASQALQSAKDRLQDASLPLPNMSRTAAGTGQPQRSVPTTTTTLSQTRPDAGVSMSGGATEPASSAARPVDYSVPDTTALSERSAAAEADTTLASDEESIAQPVLHPLDDEQRASSMADIPAGSLAEQSRATADELVHSSHQPDSMEVSESSEQTHTAADVTAAQRLPEPPGAAAPPQPASASMFRPADDPDAGQLDADGEDRTITDRVRSRLGQELDHAEWGHININTQAFGEVYLRGYVSSDELRSRIEQIVSGTEGVESVVNELHVEEQREA